MEEKNKKVDPLDQKYYDKAYFETGSKRIVDKVTGKEKVWGYCGTDWSGNFHIVQGLLKIFGGKIGSILDVGAGQGSFTDYALRSGLVAKGYDFSEYAVKTAHHYAEGHIFQADVTKGIPENEGSYDLVFCSDLLEHLRKSTVTNVIKDFYRITKKWVFLQFPVATSDADIFDAERDDESHRLYAHLMIAGHLNIQTRKWWDELFCKYGFKIRDDVVVSFRASVPREVILNWLNIAILEKQ